MYVMAAVNKEIAIDACIRSVKIDRPKATVREQFAYETSLEAPLKILED